MFNYMNSQIINLNSGINMISFSVLENYILNNLPNIQSVTTIENNIIITSIKIGNLLIGPIQQPEIGKAYFISCSQNRFHNDKWNSRKF